ncbi:Bug family tripartite tricarboxylate transporter substrate binding protein [Falsiroseomonas sp. E2-1-a4]|uniref:Bug family tripartite tricarboxylate transporter substrate binding protein n=1 Tax=Falsiroseomonas sp. E2-1-a4 TaxID=3239299 RepID=UPI003F3D7498
MRLVTPAAPGSSTDMVARLYAERLAAVWGQPVVVEPRTGADGIIAAEAMLGARDGHTLLFSPAGVVTVTPLLRDRLPFDPVKDIVPLSLVATDFLCVAVTAALPEVMSLPHLVDAARERPGTLSFAAGLGGLSLALPAFLRERGLAVTVASYRSPPDAIPDLVAGRLHVLLGPLAPMLRLARDGRVRVLAVTNPERTPAAPQVPTVIEEGFPELEVEGTIGLFGPPGLAVEARSRISEAVMRAAADPSLAERLGSAGIVPRSEPADAFSRRLTRQRAHYAAMAARHGTRAP